MKPHKEKILQTHQQHLLFSIKKNIGFIKLNRPEAFNALTPGMMASLRQRLMQWRDNDDVQAVIVHTDCEKAFCAGGDLKAVHKAGSHEKFDVLETLFREEYQLTHVIKTFPKPYISFVDGIIMGGGVGLSAHGSHCLMSEKTLAAMPETNIGYFPDVGVIHFLNQVPGYVGLYVALTGNHLKVSDALYAGFGTHYVPHEKQADLLAALKALKHKTAENIDQVVEEAAETAPESSLQKYEREINELFASETLEGIFENLESSSSDFAKETLEALKKCSPTSLAVTIEQLKRGKDLSNFADIMSMEFDLSQSFVRQPDFMEGIRAAVLDKDCAPKWSPSSLNDVSSEDVEACFAKHPRPLFSL